MPTLPDDLHHHLRRHGQEHVLDWLEPLSEAERSALVEQLRTLDLPALRALYDSRHQTAFVPPPEKIQEVPVVRLDADATAARARGEEALRQGRVAAVLVAGGQGSRLGFEHPKGMFPIGPVSRKTLFQFHAEKALAVARRYGKPLPLLVMTSDATHDETVAFFAEHANFGLPSADLAFFRQGTMPALDLTTGRLLRDQPHRLFASPNGHGGTLTALADSGLLDQIKSRGITQVFYFQVDNPLIKLADPVFLGHHLAADAQASSKVIAKDGPTDKLGNFVLVDGRCTIIEYSDLPAALAEERDAQGRLRLWAGSPAIHFFAVDFLEQVTRGATRLPFHVAKKKVPHLDDAGRPVQPKVENALKFEMFIFDALPLADRWTVVETSRREEFAPLKNATGPDSPETARRALSDQAVDWLTKAGAVLPTSAEAQFEVSPLFALDAEELAAKIKRGAKIEPPALLA
jgi:UDP-N-acetylglucosamine/UDP-N-acetylgalactosamine diphosphorylase